jgi:hypothetical protein
MTTVLLAVLAWLAGFITSLFAFALCFWLVYLPALRVARRVLRKPPALVFSVIAMLIGIVPTALIAHVWGGSGESLFTPEALLFYIMFAAVGLVVGVGFAHLPESTAS